MKPLFSLLAVLAITLFADAKSSTINKGIGEIGPNPTHFNGDVKEAKIYSKAADGRQLPSYTVYKVQDEHTYTIRGMVGDKLLSHKIFTTNNDGSFQTVAYKDVDHDELHHYKNVLENGNIIREIHTDNEQHPNRALKTFTYDEQGRLTRLNYWDDANKGTSEINKYNNNTITRTSIDKDGKPGRMDYYELDEHNNPIKITVNASWGEKKVSVYSFKYTYDDKGNYTSVAMFRNGKLFSTQYREIEYN